MEQDRAYESENETNILIVEDEPITAGYLQRALIKSGYNVTSVVSTGEAALKNISDERPDLVLMDIMLEGMLDGIETAKIIQEKYDLPVIYTTAFADKDILDRAKVTEPFGYILKPVHMRELKIVIETALYKHHTEQKMRQANEKARRTLEKAFFDFTGSICRVMEYRDFYTAQHQRRVAYLAVEMGRQMGLDQDSINALYIGGLLHDIGKIGVPIEILTKTSPLTDVEILLINAHPQIGYDIISGSVLPWDIGEIVLNHHEKLDGSGYPNGLSGSKISRNVRIITVCDVVEAMSTFRPYRAARTYEETLCELTMGRGIKYDPDVVDAMIDLMQAGTYNPWAEK